MKSGKNRIRRAPVAFVDMPQIMRAKLREVGDAHNIPICKLVSTTKLPPIVRARDQIFAELHDAGLSYAGIARYWGMEHSTVQKGSLRHRVKIAGDIPSDEVIPWDKVKGHMPKPEDGEETLPPWLLRLVGANK